MNKEEFDDEQVFVFPDELEDDLDNNVQTAEEPINEVPTVEPVEQTYEVPTEEPVEPTNEVPTVEPTSENAIINENPNAQINLMSNGDSKSEEIKNDVNIGKINLRENKSLMFALVIGTIILVAIFILPMIIF